MGWGNRKGVQQVDAPVEPEAAVDAGDADDAEPMEVTLAASLGESLHFRGELTGHEDIRIDGRFEGSITLQDRALIVGGTGHVQAEVRAHTVVIEGQMVGDILADDKVEIAASGSLQGNIRAARVVLKENSRFKGSIDTEWRAQQDDAVSAGVTPDASGDDDAAAAGQPANTIADRMAAWGEDA
jgi:cytoskeletal protein CcmA (bactofilin family)